MKLRLTLFVSVLMFLSGFGSMAVRSSAAGPAVNEGEAAALYANYCAGCHGAQREGGYGPALTDLEERSDADLFEIIAQGVGSMPALGEHLSDEEIQALVWFIQGQVGVQLQEDEGGEQPVPTPAPAKSGVDASAIFAGQCAGCHGAQGGGGYGPALTDLGGRSNAELLEIIAQGMGSMPGFAETFGETEIEALVPFMRKLSEGLSEEGKTEDTQAVTAAVPTRLSLDLLPGDDGAITARVSLQSEGGEPIPDMSITLYRQTVMGGSLPLSEVTTDSRGEALLQFAAVKGQTLALEAIYAGSDNWRPAMAEGRVKLRGTAVLPPVISGLTSPTPPPALVAILVVVIGGVWLTYGYVVYQLVSIAVQRER